MVNAETNVNDDSRGKNGVIEGVALRGDEVVVRPQVGRVLGYLVLVAVVGAVAVAILTFDRVDASRVAILGAAMVVVDVVFLVKPRIALDRRAVHLINPLSSVSITWASIIDVDTQYALNVVTAEGRWTAWGASASGMRHSLRVHHADFDEGDGLAVAGWQRRRLSDVPGCDSGDANVAIRSRLDRYRGSGALDKEAPEDVAVERDWFAIGGVLASAIAIIGVCVV